MAVSGYGSQRLERRDGRREGVESRSDRRHEEARDPRQRARQNRSQMDAKNRLTQNTDTHFSHNRECLSERPVLIQIFAESRNEWPQTGLRHVWDQLIEHASLPEQ
jgi:hypothetical protein